MTIAIASLSLVGVSAYLALASFAVLSAVVLPPCGRYLKRHLNKEELKKVREKVGNTISPETVKAH